MSPKQGEKGQRYGSKQAALEYLYLRPPYDSIFVLRISRQATVSPLNGLLPQDTPPTFFRLSCWRDRPVLENPAFL